MIPTGSAITIEITTATNTWLSVSIVSTQMLPLSEPSACSPATTSSAIAHTAATRRPAVAHASAVTPTTTSHHGRFVEEVADRIEQVDDDEVADRTGAADDRHAVAQMIAAPVDDAVHRIVQREVDRRRERARRPDLADDRPRSRTTAMPTISSMRARCGVRSRWNARAARLRPPGGEPVEHDRDGDDREARVERLPDVEVLQAGEHLLAEPFGADERGDHDDAEREVDRLVHAEQQRRAARPAARSCASVWRVVAPCAVPTSTSWSGTPPSPWCVSRIAAGRAKITVAITAGG